MSEALISSDNTWVLLAIITGLAALSIYLEQRYKWAATISGAVLALIGAMLFSNFNIIPTDAPVYDMVWSYVVPLAIPLLLFQTNIKNIWRDSGRVLIMFLLGSVGTILGAFLGFYLLHDHIPYLAEIAGMMTGSYIGGGVNFVALADTFDVPGEMVSATVVADNIMMALYILMLTIIPTIGFFRRNYRHPHMDEVEANGEEGINHAAEHWEREEISLRDIAFAIGTAFLIVAVSISVSAWLSEIIPTTNVVWAILNGLLGNEYVLITTLTMMLATFFPNYTENINGTGEIGTYLIYLFFVVIGVPASIPLIIQNSPLLLVFCFIMVLVNMAVAFFFGKIFGFTLEEIILTSNANIGGPTTATAMGVSQGWYQLTAPIILVGTFGYVIGTYAGVFVGNLLM